MPVPIAADAFMNRATRGFDNAYWRADHCQTTLAHAMLLSLEKLR